MRRSTSTWLALCLILCLVGPIAMHPCAAHAIVMEELQLPADVLERTGHEWAISVHSPCSSAAFGELTMPATEELEDEGSITWTSGDATVALTRGGAMDEELILDALKPLLGLERTATYRYRLCEHQSNHLHTPARPRLGEMATTYLQEYRGIAYLSTSPLTCEGSSTRNLRLRLVGRPASAPDSGVIAWKKQEELQSMVLLIDTSVFNGQCEAASHQVKGSNNKQQQRRSSGGKRRSAAADGSAEANELPNIVSVRLVRRARPTLSFLDRHSTTLYFAATFIIYQVVHQFASYRGRQG